MTRSNQESSMPDELERVRLSEWARNQGIARLTAYRMLRRGILPVPYERSPTGRWYVLLPRKRHGRTAIYTRAEPGLHRVAEINRQVAALTEWAATHGRRIYTVEREIADPLHDPMPRLGRLLADGQITEIAIHDPGVVGLSHFHLLVAALGSQGRIITAMHTN